MKTKFPYEGKIDFQKYWDAYMQREDAVRSLPAEAELVELARKAIVKEHLALLPILEGEAAQAGDTVTMTTVSEIPKFNKPKVTASLGRGLYNKDLETMAVGKKVGDSFSLIIQEKEVSVTVLEIKRKSAPEPTDEMVVAMGAKDFQDQLITTVDGYIKFIIEQKIDSQVATVNYYIMEAILKDYPMTEYDESDIQRLGELEKEFFIRIFMEKDGFDLSKDVPKSWKEDMGITTVDEFIEKRHDWYQMKIHQCLIYQNLLGVPDAGKTDPLDHYEVLSELMQMMFDKIKAKLGG